MMVIQKLNGYNRMSDKNTPIYTPIEVTMLDHMGDDLSVVNAARVSFHKESEWTEGKDVEYGTWTGPIPNVSDDDEKLIKYLAKHKHWSPFGHAQLQFRISAPVFVARQLVKHQIGLCWNEVSRRYVDDDVEFYLPRAGWRQRDKNAKQGSKQDEYVTSVGDKDINVTYNEGVALAYKTYNEMLDSGVCPEQARMVLPVSHMTEWYWSGSLLAFSRVCNLRLDPHAQFECRLVAEQISDYAQNVFPVSWKHLVGENRTA